MRNAWKQFLYETPEVTPAAVVTPPPVAAPWAADAATYFGADAAAAANFDRYMREKQQPYITQLEESTKDAREYYNDLQTDTDNTLRTLIEQRYGGDLATEFDALFNEPAPVVTPPVTPPADEIPEWAKPLVEDHHTRKDVEISNAAASAYETAKLELRAAHPDLTDADMPMIDSWVANPSTKGDMEVAYAAFAEQKAAYLAAHGIVPPPPPVVDPPPPVVGDVAAASATPPLATQYTKYGDLGPALRNFFAREAVSSTPPPVLG